MNFYFSQSSADRRQNKFHNPLKPIYVWFREQWVEFTERSRGESTCFWDDTKLVASIKNPKFKTRVGDEIQKKGVKYV